MNHFTDATERALADAYDATPYTGQPFCPTHPALLAAYGRLYGLTPADPRACRVLELGCGDGSNIVPMAHQLPGSQFTGIDLSPVQAATGKNLADSLKLTNIRLQARSIMDIDDGDGQFDYIIAHGVYSWVPDAVKEKILEICRHHLSSQGIAYISYNVLPGWQFNRSMRDLMLFHTRGIKDTRQRAHAAVDIVKTMLAGTEGSNELNDVQRRFFFKGLQGVQDDPSYLTHEYLEPDNHPFYFHEFVQALEKHHLQYLCDADQPDFELDRLPADAAAQLEAAATTRLDLEQYFDFLKNTRFRRSLICHAGIDVDADYRFDRVVDLFAATTLIPVLDGPDQTIADATAFKTTGGLKFSTQHPLALRVLHKLCDIRPCTISLPRLIEGLAEGIASQSDPDPVPWNEKIGQVVYSLFFNGAIDLLAAPRTCTLSVTERPVASSLARMMASSRRVTNLCHHSITIDDGLACLLLSSLDGTRDRTDLAHLLMDAVRSGTGSAPDSGSFEPTMESLHEQLDQMLRAFSRCGVLIA